MTEKKGVPAIMTNSAKNILINTTFANTDNKVNKLVMVFAFTPAPTTGFECSYRDRTFARLNQLCTGINSRPLTGIIPRYPNNSPNSCHDWQKPRRTLLATGIISRLKYQDAGRMASSGNASLLYCRAVKGNCAKKPVSLT
jgi:hypothetical protein